MAAMTTSASPSKSRSARRGWAVGLCPPKPLHVYGPTSLLIIRDSSLHDHSNSPPCPPEDQPVTEQVSLGDQASR